MSEDAGFVDWEPYEDRGFLSLVGPVWTRQGEEGPELAFQAAEKHGNLRGVVQGGMLMTIADRMLGVIGQAYDGGRPPPTVQLSVQFLAPVRIGDIVIGRGRMLRNTRTLMFLRGELTVRGALVMVADGVWKKAESR